MTEWIVRFVSEVEYPVRVDVGLQGIDEDDEDFEERILKAAFKLMPSSPYLPGYYVGDFQWDEYPPEREGED